MTDYVRKVGMWLPVSEEWLRDRYHAINLAQEHAKQTDAENAAALAEYREEAKQRRLGIVNAHAAVLAASLYTFRRAVLELHAPVFGPDEYAITHCDGCDIDGYECEPPEFPCRTYVLARDWKDPS